MANTTATIHDHLKSVDPQWERLERVDLASQAYVAMLQMIHSACRDRQVVETVIRAIPERPVDGDTSPAVTAYRARRTAYQVVMLTDRTWIFASLPVPEDNEGPAVVSIRSRKSITNVTIGGRSLSADLYTDGHVGFTAKFADETYPITIYPPSNASHRGGDVSRLLAEALSDLAAR